MQAGQAQNVGRGRLSYCLPRSSHLFLYVRPKLKRLNFHLFQINIHFNGKKFAVFRTIDKQQTTKMTTITLP